MTTFSREGVRKRALIAISLVALLIGFTFGILIGVFAVDHNNEVEEPVPGPECEEENPAVTAALSDGDPSIADKLIGEIKEDNIKDFLKYFTNNTHLAGTAMDLEQAEYVREKWLDQGLDYADVVPYKVLLSYPNGTENRVEVIYDNGTVIIGSAREEAILDESQKSYDIVPPFNAYSAAGVEEGDLVYAHYARVEDFFYLQRNLSMNLTDKIIIAKYGKIFRGDKAFNSMAVGAKGLILYSDPIDVAPAEHKNEIYPDGIYLPGSGVQRGTLFKDMMDPLTPGYPSRDYAYRIDESDAHLPTIPVHPIGYDDAKEFLSRMKGGEVIDDWRGGLNIIYRYGPGFSDSNTRTRLIITTTNQLVTTYNVVGGIRGAVEEDRYVLVGNHRDAWVFGAVDPSSGSAVLMEVSRAYGELVKSGWRPRRSLVFCSWGAEEYGLIGSNEWVEEFAKTLAARAVLYINLDSAVSGTYRLNAGASPHLFKAVYEATKKVPDPYPEEERKTVYDSWKIRRPKNADPLTLPRIGDLGSGSDYAPFMQRIGVSSVTMTYVPNIKPNVFPTYHSVYETFHLASKYNDPEFKAHAAIGRVIAELGRSFSDSLIIPMDCRDYAQRIEDMVTAFKSDSNGQLMLQENIKFDDLDNAVDNLTSASQFLHNSIDNLNKKDPMAYRIVNDKLMGFERTFIDPLGLPERQLVRHVIFAPSSKNMYASAGLPGLTDALFDIENVSTDDREERWNQVRKELATVTHMIESAAAYLDHFLTSLHRGKQNA
ncbi:N-acetylated-alpha-linked acidic dipeptidase 2-like [Glandiceps talaboti]